jgi:hypothetical protein
MADHRIALLLTTRLKQKSHSHLLGARTAKPHLVCEVTAQSAGDKEQRFAIFDRIIELAMRAREEWGMPWRELVRFQPARKEDSMPAVASELALQLARADRRHRSQRAKTQQVKSLQLLHIEWQLA